MSGKNKALKKQEKKATAATASKKEKTTAPVSKRPMLNWMFVLVAVLPFMFSWDTFDSNLAIRYTMLGGFLLLFVLYFYGFRKKVITAGWPLLVKIVFILGIAWGCWNFISLFTAINKQQVYYGISRHFLNMLLLFIVTQVASREESQLVQLCKVLSVVAILHGFIGFCQFYDLAFNNLPGNYKPYGLMANRNLFGSAQVLLMPFALFVLYKGSRPWKYVSILSLTAIILSSILSQTRSSWLGGIAIILISLLLVLLFSPVNRKKWIIGSLTGFAVIALLTFLLIKTDTEGTLSQSLKERTGTLLSSSTGATETSASLAKENISERVKIWNKTLQVIKEHPVTGVGAGNWKVIVPKYGSEGLIWASGNYAPDRPHNDYLLITAESGIPGALMYFGMWLLVAVMAFKTIVKPATEERRILNIIMLAGMAAFAIDSMFSFPAERIEHTLYLLLMTGIITGSFINNKKEVRQEQPLQKWAWAAFSLVAFFNLFLGFKIMSFEKHAMLSKAYEANGSYQLSIDEGNKAKNSFASLAPNGFPAETYVGLSYSSLKNFPQALRELNAAIKYYPYNKALLINKGTVYTEMQQYDTAISYYNQALKLTPDYDIVHFNLAANYFTLGNYKACIEHLEKFDLSNKKELLALREEATRRLATQNSPK